MTTSVNAVFHLIVNADYMINCRGSKGDIPWLLRGIILWRIEPHFCQLRYILDEGGRFACKRKVDAEQKDSLIYLRWPLFPPVEEIL